MQTDIQMIQGNRREFISHLCQQRLMDGYDSTNPLADQFGKGLKNPLTMGKDHYTSAME